MSRCFVRFRVEAFKIPGGEGWKILDMQTYDEEYPWFPLRKIRSKIDATKTM